RRLPRRTAVDAVVPAEVAAGRLPSVAPADVAGALALALGPDLPTGGHEPGFDVLPGGLLGAVALDGGTDSTHMPSTSSALDHPEAAVWVADDLGAHEAASRITWATIEAATSTPMEATPSFSNSVTAAPPRRCGR